MAYHDTFCTYSGPNKARLGLLLLKDGGLWLGRFYPPLPAEIDVIGFEKKRKLEDITERLKKSTGRIPNAPKGLIW